MRCCRSLSCVTLPKRRKISVSSFAKYPRRAASTLAGHIAKDTTQSYLSSSRNAFVNLSFEHHLLQQAPSDSVVLFLYINRPCVVIGRNQNPWAEVNLRALKDGISESQPVDLVRRRSGGGTVFHDHGNVNWTVISPAKTFTRDKHVEMVVRALRSCGVERARVNERHDIVMDTAQQLDSRRVSPADMHHTRYTSIKDADGRDQTVKVSGSAYKLTRGRALHHGTCLLQSPFLGEDGILSKLLHSPGHEHIRAKGVESVRSPVKNVGVTPEQFIEAVRTAFATMYAATEAIQVCETSASEIDAVRLGVAEMKTAAWTFGQTPQFSVTIDSSHRFTGGVTTLLPGTSVHLEAKHGKVLSGSIKLPSGEDIFSRIKGFNLTEDCDWSKSLMSRSGAPIVGGDTAAVARVADVLENLLPTAKTLGYV